MTLTPQQDRILAVLRAWPNDFISSEAIAAEIGTTNGVVKLQVRNARRNHAPIESKIGCHGGYRIAAGGQA